MIPCERIDFICGEGTEVLLSCPIPSTIALDELIISIPLRCNHPNVQVLAEVTFPKTPSPSGDGPLKATIRGPTVSRIDEWTEISLGGSQLPFSELLKDAVWKLRPTYGIPIDSQLAYVDRVLVNVYDRPGRHRIYLGAPTLSGNISPSETTLTAQHVIRDLQIGTVSFETDDERPPARSQREGSVIEIDQAPIFARMIQHNGETFEYLQGLGFNVIQLPGTATSEQLRRARELGVWLVCPPPPSTGLRPMGSFFDPVIAWSLGEQLEAPNLLTAQNLAREVLENDPRKGRPLFANVHAEWRAFGQVSDILSLGVEPMGTQFPIASYDDWIKAAIESLSNTNPVWADVQTEHTRSMMQQAGFLAGRLPPLPLAREEIETLAVQAIAGGARGLRFRSRNRLDSNDPQTRLRAQTLTWLNHRLQLIEPWVMGGVVMGQLPLTDQPLQVTALKTNRSQLLLIQQQTGTEQRVAGDAPIQTIQFQDVYSSIADQAYLISDHGVLPLSQNRNATGAVIQLDNCPANAAVLLTQDPAVIQRFNQLYQQQGESSAYLAAVEIDGPVGYIYAAR
ncbi:MAG: hypothetical protein R3C03_08705 [Pirellulaceae bacterium]